MAQSRFQESYNALDVFVPENQGTSIGVKEQFENTDYNDENSFTP